jgi:hypothetical protein
MKHQRLQLLLIISALTACSANGRWLEGGVMGFEVNQVDAKTYSLAANGAGSQSRAQVERGFLVRAAELCSPAGFDHTAETSTSTYRDWNGGITATHSRYVMKGTVSCK